MMLIAIATILLITIHRLHTDAFSFDDPIDNNILFQYDQTNTAGKFNWNITVNDLLRVQQEVSTGIFHLSTNYILHDQHFDVHVYEKDCLTEPSPSSPFTVVSDNTTVSISNGINDFKLVLEYNQTVVESTTLWDSNSQDVEFCLRVNNYLPDTLSTSSEAIPIHFHEVTYHIDVDVTAQFSTSLDVIYTIPPEDGRDDDEVGEGETAMIAGQVAFGQSARIDRVYHCDNANHQLFDLPDLPQGVDAQICLGTNTDSQFAVDSVKDLIATQDGKKTFPYISDFEKSPLAEITCVDVFSSLAICRVRIQLLASYFEDDDPSDVALSGTVKMNFISIAATDQNSSFRHLSVDVPLNINVKAKPSLAKPPLAKPQLALPTTSEFTNPHDTLFTTSELEKSNRKLYIKEGSVPQGRSFGLSLKLKSSNKQQHGDDNRESSSSGGQCYNKVSTATIIIKVVILVFWNYVE